MRQNGKRISIIVANSFQLSMEESLYMYKDRPIYYYTEASTNSENRLLVEPQHMVYR